MNWPFHRAVPRYDHAANLALVNAMAQTPSPASTVLLPTYHGGSVKIIAQPATATITATKEQTVSFLSTIGKDFKAVFAFLGSSKGQAIVAGTENLVEVGATVVGVGAPVTAGINLLNTWMGEIVKAQALGEAAAATGTTSGNLAKASSVLTAMVPQVAAFAQTQGLSATSAANLNLINTSLVTALTALGSATTAAPAPTPAAAAA
jgi:hypothetical protein